MPFKRGRDLPTITIEIHQTEGERNWVAEVIELPGVMARGISKQDVLGKIAEEIAKVLKERFNEALLEEQSNGRDEGRHRLAVNLS